MFILRKYDLFAKIILRKYDLFAKIILRKYDEIYLFSTR